MEGTVMWIFIKEIPATTTQRSLAQFLNKSLGNHKILNIFSSTELKQCSVLKITDPGTGESEFHAVAEIESSKPEPETLRLLDGQQLQGRRLEVRKFHHRATSAEAWQYNPIDKQQEIRRCDRRRDNLQIELRPAVAVSL